MCPRRQPTLGAVSTALPATRCPVAPPLRRASVRRPPLGRQPAVLPALAERPHRRRGYRRGPREPSRDDLRSHLSPCSSSPSPYPHSAHWARAAPPSIPPSPQSAFGCMSRYQCSRPTLRSDWCCVKARLSLRRRGAGENDSSIAYLPAPSSLTRPRSPTRVQSRAGWAVHLNQTLAEP